MSQVVCQWKVRCGRSAGKRVRSIRLKRRCGHLHLQCGASVVLEGLRGETPLRELCRREGIHTNMYYGWSKEFLDAGKQRLVGDTQRQADSQEVKQMRQEVEQLKQLVAELSLQNRVLKKSLLGKEVR